MEKRNETIVVIGLGYVGLPLVAEACRAGLRCIGLDRSERIVESLSAGRSHIDDISTEQVGEMLAAGFVATTDESCLDDADAAIICVPTPLNEDQTPDLAAVESATATIARHLHPGMLVVLESTTYPGTTDGIVRERLESGGLVAGVDFHLAFSPERIDPGNPRFGLRNTPKVVGGHTAACTARATELYGQIVDEVVPVSGTREAEMAKLLENTYRHVNIALMNEIAVFSHDLGIDLWESIRAAATKPFGFSPFYPGPGVGGHCIPIDPNYLSHSVRTLGYQFRFVELAQEVSNRMPAYVVARLQEILNDSAKAMNGARIAVLGLTYKADISDDRETPARPIIRLLRKKGADIVAHDPHLEEFLVDEQPVVLERDLSSAVEGADVVVLLQMHSSFDIATITGVTAPVFDTRGVLSGPTVVRL